MQRLQKLFDPLILSNPDHQQKIRRSADNLLATAKTAEELCDIEESYAQHRGHYGFATHLVIKLARSKDFLRRQKEPMHLSVVFAIYKEHTRILRHDEHEHGEDFLREKIRQMQWLCHDLPHMSWDMVVVDDGCPEQSGRLAQEILYDHPGGGNVKVSFLADAIQEEHPIIHPMTSTDDSRKGGAVALGLWEATRNPQSGHIVIFTDADLSTDLGQCGLLAAGIVDKGADAAIGSRREPLSVVVKGGQRNNRGKLFIYLWKRLLPNLAPIIDTQCGFKAFRADVARLIVQNLKEKQFAFDIELPLKTALNRAESIEKIPIAWFDSEAASTTADLQPYLPMLQSIVGFYRTYLPADHRSDEFADLIDRLDEASWSRLLDNIPEDITSREPAKFIHFDRVSPLDLADAAGL